MCKPTNCHDTNDISRISLVQIRRPINFTAPEHSYDLQRAMPIVATESSPDAEILPVSEPSPPIHETPPVAKKKSRKLMTRVKQPKRPKKPKVKVDKNIDFSARLLSQATDAQLSQGYNPSTRQFDTSKGLRVPAGTLSLAQSPGSLVSHLWSSVDPSEQQHMCKRQSL